MKILVALTCILCASNGIFLFLAIIGTRAGGHVVPLARQALASSAFALLVLALLVPFSPSSPVALLALATGVMLALTGFASRRSLRGMRERRSIGS
jgi:uncharacterized transporter YbjL